MGFSKVASDQIKLRVSRRKLMLTTVVAKMQPVSTGVIVHLDVVDAMRNLGCVSQAAQPLSILRSICRKIQNDSHPSPKNAASRDRDRKL